MILPEIPDRLLTCPEVPLAPVGEDTDAKDDSIWKVALVEAYKTCRERNEAIGDILRGFEKTFEDELDQG
ncbi:hypothetical protein E4680_11780 [Candidatus Macondimonas diazotrophica]|uniref:Uncharacterized protein n=1 Tax=Candidatus Macondimonas diazotrophica TaxID=2305248 RepID=A0A4Z0F796_9GAMM|nr:hypothetical protein E4680_11780 [Candidatus Macondimonas diazotrophica]